jgi:tetratricopeptide (TPR) repeat protein
MSYDGPTLEEVDVELDSKIERVLVYKKSGNDLYSSGDFAAALDQYRQGIAEFSAEEEQEGGIVDGELKEILAALYGNAAACLIAQEKFEDAIEACDKAIKFQPKYEKVLLRRVKAAEKLEKYTVAIEDLKVLVEIADEKGDRKARLGLEKQIRDLEKKNEVYMEKQKEEVMGKLKDLGNTILGKFGMSLNDFQAVKDPQTGSYSIQMNRGNK